MKKGRKLGTRSQTISKYLNCLTAYQQKSGSISNLTEITSKLRVSSNIGSFLYRKGIIYKKDNLYYWNDVYEPNIKIVKAILNDKSVKNDKYLESVNKKSTPTLFDQKIQYKRRVKIEPEKVKEQPNVNNTVQIGVIRKFIKWLW